MATTPLYLTAAEKILFEKLPDDVKKGMEVEEETIVFQDSEEKMQIRMRNLSVQLPALEKLQKEASTKKYKTEEVAQIVETTDLSDLSENDLMELSFAWGPDVFTRMIAVALPAVSTAEDLKTAATFAGIRHGLLLALSPASVS